MIELLGAAALSAAPAFLLLWYFYRRDRARPEPIGLIGRSVLYGFLAVAPAAAIEYLLGRALPSGQSAGARLLQAFVVAAGVEESVKLFFVRSYLYRRPEFDERMDGIVYSICVSLGFAFVEDFMYGYNDLLVLLFRAFTAVPLHAVAAGFMGYQLGLAKVEGRDPGRGMAAGLAWAVAIHGLYDFLILTGGAASLLVLPLLAAAWLVLGRLVRRALDLDGADAGLPASQNPPEPLL
jgi:RsiW-degrading membrane proteinase PrsW (M82 family)